MNKLSPVSVEQSEFSFADNENADFGAREARPKYARGRNGMCSGCQKRPSTEKSRYCLQCHTAYMREWRKTHPLNREQKQRDGARSMANVYQRRGKLLKQPCEVCGKLEVEKHHDDYTKPLEVRWLCKKHHQEHHKIERTPTGRQIHKVQMDQRLRRRLP